MNYTEAKRILNTITRDTRYSDMTRDQKRVTDMLETGEWYEMYGEIIQHSRRDDMPHE